MLITSYRSELIVYDGSYRDDIFEGPNLRKKHFLQLKDIFQS